MISDLVDGVNKFGTDWKRIRMEYKFTATVEAIKIKWRRVKQQEYITLENGKWKVNPSQPGNYSWFH